MNKIINRLMNIIVMATMMLGGYSSASAAKLNTPPSTPLLASPVNNTLVTSLTPRFDWSNVNGATGYRVQISQNKTFTNILTSATIVPSSYTPEANLQGNQTFYWRVQTKSINGNSLWSATRTITTANPTVSTVTPTKTSLPSTATSIPTNTRISPSATPTAALTPVSAQVESGNIYYVAKSGNNNNPGTLTQPWLTIQKAANTVSAGDKAVVLTGNYPERVSVTRPGIRFEASGLVVMRGFSITADNTSVSGFEMDLSAIDEEGIDFIGKDSIFENNYIHDASRGGILINVHPGNETATSNNIVRNNRIYKCGMNGISVLGRSNLIEGNEIWGIVQYPPNWINPPTWVDADGIRFHGSGHLIRGNYIHDILYSSPLVVDAHIDCFQTFSSPTFHEAASNIVIEQNICKNAQAQTSAERGQGFMIENATNITIRNNLIKAYVGVNAVQVNTGLAILNNTFVNDLTLPSIYNPVGITIDASNSQLKNNIFFDTLGHMVYDAPAGLITSRNLNYRSDGYDMHLWETNTYSHANDLWGVNPMLDSNYHPLPASPVCTAGQGGTYIGAFPCQ